MPFPVVVCVDGAVFSAVIFSDSESTNEVFRSQCLWPHFSNETVDGDYPPWIVLKELPTGSTEMSGFLLKRGTTAQHCSVRPANKVGAVNQHVAVIWER